MTPSEILGQLIALPSVNPMGREDLGEIQGEQRMSDWLVDFFHGMDAPYERFEVLQGRGNVIARFDADTTATQRTVLLDAHQDTVPVEGMTVAPFAPTLVDGRIFGRGSVDVKGSMAAMLYAFRRLCRERPAGAANVVLSCTCDEEATALGIRQLVTYWQNGGNKSRLLAEPPSVAVVAEPTELNVVVAHPGVLRFRIHTRGKACHSSHPELGRNAIYLMARVITRLEEEAERLAIANIHPLCGGPKLSVCRVDGGSAVNIIPEHCVIEVDRRVIPGEDSQKIWAELCNVLAELGNGDVGNYVDCEPAWINAPALRDDNNSVLAEQLLTAVEAVAGPRRQIGVPFCTNASFLSGAGIPTVVFGAGSIAQAHTCDENIEIAQLDAAAEVYFRFCCAG